MVLGRAPALWLALVAAALNTAVIVFGVALTDLQVAALNVLFVSVIGLVANEADPTARSLTRWGTATPPTISGDSAAVRASSPIAPVTAAPAAPVAGIGSGDGADTYE